MTTQTHTEARELIQLDVKAEDYAAARRAIRKVGGHIVSSAPSAYGYSVHYVLCGGAR